jgi:hypothetical protein
MPEIIGAIAVGFAIGVLVGGVMAYEKGWKAGYSWAMTNILGRLP